MKKFLSLLSIAVLVIALSVFTNQSAQAAGGSFQLVRLAGPDRIKTAVEISKQSFPAGSMSQTVYLYNSEQPIDALAAAPLAATDTVITSQDPNFATQGPLLPVKNGTEITGEVKAEIQRLMPAPSYGSIVILGGTAAVTDAAITNSGLQIGSQVPAVGGYIVSRIAGANRFKTAALIAKFVREAIAPNVPDMNIVNGYAMADALAIAPWAANFDPTYAGLSDAGGVILLTYKDMAPRETVDFVDGQSGGFINLVGGGSVVDPSVGELLSQRHWGNPSTYGRYGGANRYETALIIANAFIINGGPLTDFAIGLANGRTMVDALPAGPFMGRIPAPLLLTDGENLRCETANYLGEWGDQVKDGYIFGGTTVITQTAEDQAEALINGLTTPANLGC